ncbi:MAG: GNAT family N-acetyltransferase [Xanthomarina sp.]
MIEAKPSDVEITYQIMCNSIKLYIEKLWAWDDTHQQKIHKKKFKATKTILIEFQKTIVGYLVLSENENEIFLENLLIDVSFQNLGIGKDVMKSVIKKSNSEMKTIRLKVFKINMKAQKFYQNLGFEKTSENEFNFEMKRAFRLSKKASPQKKS